MLVFVHAFALAVDDTAPLLIDATRDGVLVTLPPWNALGMTVCLLAVALYGIWYWTRTLQRLGPYLETWLRRHDLHADSDSGDRSRMSLPTRPVGGMVPPMIAFVAVVWYVGTEGSHVGVIFGAVWPLTIALLIGGVALTARRDPQAATTDGIAVPIALLVQNGGMFSAIGAIGGGPGSLTFSLQPVVGFLVGTILWLYFFADVTQFAQGRTDRGRYAVAMYLAMFGVITGILGLIETGGMGGPLRLLGAIALGSAAVFAVEKRLWPAE